MKMRVVVVLLVACFLFVGGRFLIIRSFAQTVCESACQGPRYGAQYDTQCWYDSGVCDFGYPDPRTVCEYQRCSCGIELTGCWSRCVEPGYCGMYELCTGC
jgi:hypothetical protein